MFGANNYDDMESVLKYLKSMKENKNSYEMQENGKLFQRFEKEEITLKQKLEEQEIK